MSGLPTGLAVLKGDDLLCSVQTLGSSHLWRRDAKTGSLSAVEVDSLAESWAIATGSREREDVFVLPVRGSYGYTAFLKKTGRLDLESGKIVGTVLGAASSPGDQETAVLTTASIIYFLNTKGKPFAKPIRLDGAWNSIAAIDSGFVAVGNVGSTKGRATYFDSRGNLKWTIDLPRPAFKVNGNRDRVAIGMGWDDHGSVCVLDVSKKSITTETKTHSRTVTAVALLSSGEIVAGDDTGSIALIETGKVLSRAESSISCFDKVAWEDNSKLNLRSVSEAIGSRFERSLSMFRSSHVLDTFSGLFVEAVKSGQNTSARLNPNPEIPTEFYAEFDNGMVLHSYRDTVLVRRGNRVVLSTLGANVFGGSFSPDGSRLALVCSDGVIRVYERSRMLFAYEAAQKLCFPSINFALFKSGDWAAWSTDERTGVLTSFWGSAGASDLVGLNIQSESGCNFKPISAIPDVNVQPSGLSASLNFSNTSTVSAAKDVTGAPILTDERIEERGDFFSEPQGANKFTTDKSEVDIVLGGLKPENSYHVFRQGAKDGILTVKGTTLRLSLVQGTNHFILRAMKNGVTSGDLPFSIYYKNANSPYVPVSVMSIGIAQYSGEFQQLPFAVNDAKAIQGHFLKSGAIHVEAPDPANMTRAGLLAAVKTFVQNTTNQSQGKPVDIVFYISSHGVPVLAPDSQQKELYQSLVVTTDCTAKSGAKWTKEQGGVLWSELIALVRQKRDGYSPNAVLFVVDSCFAGLVMDTLSNERIDENRSKAAAYAHSVDTRRMSEEAVALYAS
ncbi:MAG TPA: caspase family protein, partial [Fimbriimonadaceae bacterium]|nr:caspase family protein [Fimbriimonadaceae bacterium]